MLLNTFEYLKPTNLSNALGSNAVLCSGFSSIAGALR
jgi:hypothetical protein